MNSHKEKRKLQLRVVAGSVLPLGIGGFTYITQPSSGWKPFLEVVEGVVFGSWLVLFGVVWLYAKAASYPERYLPYVENRITDQEKLPSSTAAQIQVDREQLQREKGKIEKAKLDQEAAEFMLATVAVLAGITRVISFFV
jgi:hypothetical protein